MSRFMLRIFLKKLRRILCAISVGVVAAFFIGEFIVRLTPHMRVSTVMWAPDEAMGAVLRPNQKARFSAREFDNVVVINSHGQHDYEQSFEKAKDVFRILVLGDSFVEGLHVGRDELFFSRLCERLNNGRGADQVKYEFIALARSGWGTAQQLKALEVSGIRYKPDLVMLCFVPANDFFNSYRPLMGNVFRPYYVLAEQGQLELQAAQCDTSRDSMVYKLYKKSQLICCLKQSLGMLRFQLKHASSVPPQFGIYQVGKSEDWQRAIKTTLACIKKMNDICEDTNTKFFCVSLTTKYLVEQIDIARYHELYPAMAGHKYNFDHPYDLLEDFHKNNSIPYASMLKYFQDDYLNTERKSHFEEDGHWNEYGHNLAADFLFEYFKNHEALLALDG